MSCLIIRMSLQHPIMRAQRVKQSQKLQQLSVLFRKISFLEVLSFGLSLAQQASFICYSS